MLNFLETLIIQINHVQTILVERAFNFNELGRSSEGWILSNDNELISKLIRRVKLVLEHLVEHDALIKLLDVQATIHELML